MNLKKIYEEIDQKEEELIVLRRDFHHYAESGWAEFRTTAKIVEFLKKHGIMVSYGAKVINPDFACARPCMEYLAKQEQRAVTQGADFEIVSSMDHYTGAVAVIKTGKPGPVIALRFDIDSNDLKESISDEHKPRKEGFASVNPDMMHACGHDGHTAIGLITAALLNEHRKDLCGTIKILFQPAEEGDRGAVAMVKTGILDDVDVALAAHIYGSKNDTLGLAGTQTGLYATTKFDLMITGKSSHAGASPEAGCNAINAACLAVTGMQSLLQDGRGNGRLNVGKIVGGSGRNIIAESCSLCMETRGSNTEVEQRLYQGAVGIAERISEAFGCSCFSEIKGICPTGNGDMELAAQIAEVASAIPDFAYTQEELVQTGGTDDFSCMMNAVREHGGKACYMALLTPLKATHHNNLFDFDERILKAGVKAFMAVVEMLHTMK